MMARLGASTSKIKLSMAMRKLIALFLCLGLSFSLDFDQSENTWIFYASTWDVSPTLEAEIMGGSVYRYEQDGVVRYRFVPTPYNPAQDGFYEDFDGTNLTFLIVSRG